MTADAKVGLLLGLIFIVMIAFLVNGLPNFLQTANAENAVDVSITVPPPNEDLVIDEGVVQRAKDLQRHDIPLRQVPPPQEVIVLDDPAQAGTPEPTIDRSVVPSTPVSPVHSTVQTHVVRTGDNLAVIAQKYYGKEEGNRHVVIDALFKANKSVLASPDKVRVGQKLTIPPLDTLMSRSVQSVSTVQQTADSPTFRERLSSLFERSDQESSYGIHVVKNGESLWGIAESALGDGRRYKEILNLNKAIKDADDVVVGMRLKIPNP